MDKKTTEEVEQIKYDREQSSRQLLQDFNSRFSAKINLQILLGKYEDMLTDEEKDKIKCVINTPLALPSPQKS